MFANLPAVSRSAALSAALPLFMPSAIPICCSPGLLLKSPPSNCVSSFVTPPPRPPDSCLWIRWPFGSPLPVPRLPLHLPPAAKSNPTTFKALSGLRDRQLPSINSASRLSSAPSARNAPPIWLSVTPATKASSSTTAPSTVCLSDFFTLPAGRAPAKPACWSSRPEG